MKYLCYVLSFSLSIFLVSCKGSRFDLDQKSIAVVGYTIDCRVISSQDWGDETLMQEKECLITGHDMVFLKGYINDLKTDIEKAIPGTKILLADTFKKNGVFRQLPSKVGHNLHYTLPPYKSIDIHHTTYNPFLSNALKVDALAVLHLVFIKDPVDESFVSNFTGNESRSRLGLHGDLEIVSKENQLFSESFEVFLDDTKNVDNGTNLLQLGDDYRDEYVRLLEKLRSEIRHAIMRLSS